MTRCIIYCRVSTAIQAENDNIELQVKSLTDYAKKHDMEIIDCFKDDGVSGSKELQDRPALLKLMKFLETNDDVDTVLIYSLTRLARDLVLQELLIKKFAELKKNIVSVLEPNLSDNDPFRKAFRQMIGIFSEFERSLITIRMKTGRDQSVAKGNWHGGLIYGYNSKDGQLTINKKEAEVVKKIYYLKRYQKMSVARIAKHLNQNNIPTKRGVSLWHPSSIRKILSNKMYKGFITYKNQTYSGAYSKIL